MLHRCEPQLRCDLEAREERSPVIIYCMTPIEAEEVLKDIEGILQQLPQYHHLSEEQRFALHSRAGLSRQKIAEVLKVLKTLKRTAVGGLPSK